MAYCTVAEVKGSAIPATTFAQALWTTDAPTEDRIAEADAVIASQLAAIGYSVSDLSSSVPLVKLLSILYSRYAVLRDIYDNRGPSQASNEGGGGKQYLSQFNDLMKMLIDGRAFLVNSSGAVLEMVSGGVQNATDGVGRIFTMDDPENIRQSIPETYISSTTLGVTDGTQSEEDDE